MADLSDVEAALVDFSIAAVHPGGPTMPSLTGKPLRVYRGWPQTGALELDLASGIVNISVFPVPGATRNTTRWGPIVYTTRIAPTLSVKVFGNAVTFSGKAGAGQLAGVLVDNQAFVYRGNDSDTSATVAAVLADDIKSVRSCWLSGSTISLPGVVSVVARVVADVSTLTEWARQEQAFRIGAWCPDPTTRDAVCGALGAAFSAVGFIQLPDSTSARVRYRATTSFDDSQDAQLYRRDLVYEVEYATSITQPATSMLFGDLQILSTDIYA